MQGWIKLHRELTDKPIWECSTAQQKVILVTLLLMANHAEKEWEFKGERYKARPGQFVTSLESIAKKAGSDISIQNVRTALKRFERYEFLTSTSTNKNRLVTIVNWDLYQTKSDDLTSKLTSNQQATNKQLTTNKNDKNAKNDKKEKLLSDLQSEFDEFWSLYKRPGSNKKKSFENFVKARKQYSFETIKSGTIRYMEHCRKNNTDPKYIKMATTFLNQEGFNDEYDIPVTGTTIAYKEFDFDVNRGEDM